MQQLGQIWCSPVSSELHELSVALRLDWAGGSLHSDANAGRFVLLLHACCLFFMRAVH